MLPAKKPTLHQKINDPFEYAKLTQGQKDELVKEKAAEAAEKSKKVEKPIKSKK